MQTNNNFVILPEMKIYFKLRVGYTKISFVFKINYTNIKLMY